MGQNTQQATPRPATNAGLTAQQLDELRSAIYADMTKAMDETQRRSEAWQKAVAEAGYGTAKERDAYHEYLRSAGVSEGFSRALLRLDEARRSARQAWSR